MQQEAAKPVKDMMENVSIFPPQLEIYSAVTDTLNLIKQYQNNSSFSAIKTINESVYSFKNQINAIASISTVISPSFKKSINLISSQNALLGKSISNALNAKSYLDIERELDNSLSLLDEHESNQVFNSMNDLLDKYQTDISKKNDKLTPTKVDISEINKENSISVPLNKIEESNNQTKMVKKPSQSNKTTINKHILSLNQQQINRVLLSSLDIISSPTIGYVYQNDPTKLLYTEIIANALIVILIYLNSTR